MKKKYLFLMKQINNSQVKFFQTFYLVRIYINILVKN